MLDRPYDDDDDRRSGQTDGPWPTQCAGASDRAVVSDLYQNTSGELTSYIRRAFGNGPPDPDEVMQEAFTRLYEQPDLSVIKNLRAFLWRTARNLVLTDKRQAEARSKYDFEVEALFFAIDAATLSPENVVQVREQLYIVNKVLKQMPERRRKAFLWHRIDGLTFVEVGIRLGMNRRHVSKQIAKAAFDIEKALSNPHRADRS